MRVIQQPQPQVQGLPNIPPEIPIRAFRGLNTYDPFSIEDGFFTDMANLTSDDFPAISVRPGYSVLGSAIGTKVLGLGVWKDSELHAVFNDGTWRKWTGSAWSTLASGLSTTAEWSFTNFDGNLGGINLIGANGVDSIKRYDGSTVQNLSGAPSGGNFITTYQNRLWCAVGNEIKASALDNPTSWSDFSGDDSDSYAKTIESTAGEDVNMLSGSLTKLTIGLPSSINELFGGVPSDFNTHLATEDVGVSNNKSAASQGGVLRFMHNLGIFIYTGASMPSKSFSDIVAGELTNITSDSVVGSDGTKQYFLTSEDNLLVYDPRVDVRTWTRWKDIEATHFALFQDNLYIGDASGRVLKLGGATDDAGTAISWYAVTKPFTSMSAAQKQRWLSAWIFAELATGSTLDIYISKSASGDSDWDLVHSVTGTGNQIQRIFIPTNFPPQNYVRIKFAGTGWARLHEFTRKIRNMPIR